MTTDVSVESLRLSISQIASSTNRGELLFPSAAYKPLDEYHRPTRERLVSLLETLETIQTEAGPVKAESLNGEWELLVATKQLFRSSPFFMAIQNAFGDAQSFGQSSSELFFRLHELQVKSWGLSTIGRVAQRIDVTEEAVFESYFDTIIFSLTVIPIVGWWKLLPTFGGRVVTLSDKLRFDESTGELAMEVATTEVVEAPGVPLIPLKLDRLLMNRKYPVRSVWQFLPWNKGPPKASSFVTYCDGSMRVMKDSAGEFFVYVRPLE